MAVGFGFQKDADNVKDADGCVLEGEEGSSADVGDWFFSSVAEKIFGIGVSWRGLGWGLGKSGTIVDWGGGRSGRKGGAGAFALGSRLMAGQAFGTHEYEVACVTSMEVVGWEETPGVFSVVGLVQVGDDGSLVGSSIVTAVYLALVGFAALGG